MKQDNERLKSAALSILNDSRFDLFFTDAEITAENVQRFVHGCMRFGDEPVAGTSDLLDADYQWISNWLSSEVSAEQTK